MAFEKVETQGVDFPAIEREILAFWDKSSAFDQLKAKNQGKPKWSFLDGPITANNPMGVHHAWNRTYKDVFNRYFAMAGHELRYQQGFDCQGLWVEVEVEKELKLQSKRDIENLVENNVEASIGKFVQMCKDRVNKFARLQTEQSIRLGYWMDWDRTDAEWAKSPDDRKSYFTMSEKNNYTIWSFLKKCHHRGLIYRGYDAMPWCGRCGVGISEQEKAEGYKLIDHRSVFVKFPLRSRPGEYLLAWTTTPWTLSSNIAAAVNPELTYLQVQLKGEIYYIAKGAFKFNRMEASGGSEDESATESTGKKSRREWLEGVPHLKTIEQMFKEKAGKEGFQVIGELKGEALVGWEYDGPFDEVPAQNHEYGYPKEVVHVVERLKWAPAITGKQAHRVIAWKDVGETEGTGIVHIAPGCGQADFLLGKEQGLPPIAPLNDAGCFLEGFGELSGKSATDTATADLVFESLKSKDRLFAIERYVHKYPHCWRCKNELLFRLIDEWFIDMRWREEIMEVVKKVQFLPESVNGQARELDWLKNMGDWMISKKRYWGLALPIWVDDDDPTQFEVIGSREELRERAVEGWTEFEGNTPHRPYVDRIKIRNPKTGNLMSRVPDVGNPWLDAGIVGFSTLKWDEDRDYWKQWYPADFITESFPGQFRNWFYALLALSTMMSDGQPPFKTLLGFATVRDQFGKEMHKSEGNSIEFIGAANDGYELFRDLEANQTVPAILKELPKGYLSYREDSVTIKSDTKKRVYARYKPIGADVIRWLYCRHNPAQNLNFGPEPTDEIRAKFIIKVWNCYAFFCNYARLDQFNANEAFVPVSERSDLDRWILSELQLLVQQAHQAFTSYNLMSFALQAERFVDDQLSNWYIRRNRGRFQKSEQDLDKKTAHQTLYTVLTTLTRLLAPCIPFLCEKMWQNLRRADDAESVHLMDYPLVEQTLIDEQLSQEMDALLTVITLGGAARNLAKVNVRKPMAELVVKPGTEVQNRAVKRFESILLEELNLKKVTLVDTPILQTAVKLNMKTAGAKCGPKLKDVNQIIAQMDTVQIQAMVDKLRTGVVELASIELDSNDFQISYSAPEGWVGAADKGTQVKLDTTITEALAIEGLARDIIRQIQELRKKAGLEMEDRIELFAMSDGPKLQKALQSQQEYIAEETLTRTWATQAITEAKATTTVEIDGEQLVLQLIKWE